MVRGWRAFVDVGQALATIRDRRLYREGYRAFAAYCLAKWRYHRAHEYRLIRRMTAPYRPTRLIPLRLAGRASRNHEPARCSGALKEADECLDSPESDLRAGTANLADLAFIARLRQCLRALASRSRKPNAA